ncbi:MAG: SRPBCC domain-containing protein [Ectothiorhodospiraceae bacterium]|nr:SRPBCC domain-containing protein [Ectothiorhodospiraceae bacterium]
MRKEIVVEVDIEAPPETVWQVLLDFPAYAEWNPLITAARLSGEARTAERLRLARQLPGRPPEQSRPELLRVLPAKELSWLERICPMAGLLDAEQRFVLEPEREGAATRLLQRRKFSGVLMPLFWVRRHRAWRAGMGSMNRALKARCEDLVCDPADSAVP